MTKTTLSLLDQTELLQLAINASSGDDAGAAIGYLKEAVSRPDATALAHYLLGAEYAQSKLYQRAADEMEAAIALDPALSIARFQLGLLWLSGGAADRAGQVLAPLAELPDTDPLHQFGVGLCHLIKEQLDNAARHLQAGLTLNTTNAPLNGDMQRMLDEIARIRAVQPAAAAPAEEVQAEEQHHVLLSAYTAKTSH